MEAVEREILAAEGLFRLTNEEKPVEGTVHILQVSAVIIMKLDSMWSLSVFDQTKFPKGNPKGMKLTAVVVDYPRSLRPQLILNKGLFELVYPLENLWPNNRLFLSEGSCTIRHYQKPMLIE